MREFASVQVFRLNPNTRQKMCGETLRFLGTSLQD